MSQSPLIIENYYYRRAQYALKKEFEDGVAEMLPDPIRPKLEVTSEIAQNEEDASRWRVLLDIKVGHKEKNFPYTIEISMTGFFRIAEGYPVDKSELLVEVNGASILYAAARDFAAILSFRNPYPPILFPSLSFVPKPEKPKVAKKLPIKSGKKSKK